MDDEEFKPDPGAAEDDADDPYVPGADEADQEEEDAAMEEAEEADPDYEGDDGALAIRKKKKVRVPAFVRSRCLLSRAVATPVPSFP